MKQTSALECVVKNSIQHLDDTQLDQIIAGAGYAPNVWAAFSGVRAKSDVVAVRYDSTTCSVQRIGDDGSGDVLNFVRRKAHQGHTPSLVRTVVTRTQKTGS